MKKKKILFFLEYHRRIRVGEVVLEVIQRHHSERYSNYYMIHQWICNVQRYSEAVAFWPDINCEYLSNLC